MQWTRLFLRLLQAEILIEPWRGRKDLAVQYMKKAIETNQCEEVIEEIEGATLTTIFVPDTQTVELELVPSPESESKMHCFSESMSYDFLIKNIDEVKASEPSNIPVQEKPKVSSSWCGLQ